MPPLLATGARLANGPLTVDDAFITFRYAENLRRGAGLVYNPGEMVLGTTTPLYAALLSALPLTLGSLPAPVLVLNAALDAAVCVLLVWLGIRLSGALWVGALAGLGYALAPMSVAFSAGGMETPLFILLVLGSFALSLGGRTAPACAVAALATLTRPEGVLVCGLILLDALRRDRRIPWGGAAASLALLVPWTLVALLTYGSPIPNSVSAKAATYDVSPVLNLAALAFGAGLPGFSVLPLADGDPPLAVLFACAAVALVSLYTLARMGAGPALLREPRALPLLLFAPLYILAYLLAGLRGVRMFHWYLVPLVPFYVLYIAIGAAALARTRPERARLIVASAFVLLLAWDLGGLGISRGHFGTPTYPVGLSLAREQAYRAAGLALRDRLRPGEVIAAPEIGALGYYSGAPILDTVGLVSPIATRYYPLPANMLIGDNAVPPDLVRDTRPTYVVALEQFLTASVLRDEAFLKQYQLTATYPARVWESDAVVVYRRTDAP